LALIQALNLSHIVIASPKVRRMTEFFQEVFGITPHYANDEFSDFVLPGGARIAFFNPTGKSAKFFRADSSRESLSLGITVKNVNEFYEHCLPLSEKFALTFSGPPKDHPWGEPSFLLIDPDGNRWEVTNSPSEQGLLVNRE
jgi:catechol 2,3-dioxygenase-like lactoylglutathione lyase family enzyme